MSKEIPVDSICFNIKKASSQDGVIEGEIAIKCTNQAGESIEMIVLRQELEELLKA